MAEALFRQTAEQCEIRSAGISAWTGDSISHQAREALERRGIDFARHRSTLLSPWLVDWATHIFVMTRGHYMALVDQYPEARGKIWLYLAPGADPECVMGKDVADPYGGNAIVYEETLKEMEAGIPALRKYLAGE